VRQRLSQHEYPRLVEFVAELPKTPAGKVNRKMLRQGKGNVADTMERSFPKITEEGLDALRQRIGVKIGQTASRGATRRRATTSATTPTASATTTRCGACRSTPGRHRSAT
jgi:hypothetical protein